MLHHSARPTPPRRPTMVDVARRAGVSLKTVSRVVNNEPAVGPELVGRVLNAISELGFRRNDIARNLRSRRVSATIGLLIEEIANPFYAMIAGVAAEIAATHQTLLITASSEEDPDREHALLLEMAQRRVDGLLVVPAGMDHSFLRREVEMGMPVVFLDRPPEQLLADVVLLDNQGGSRAGIRSLLAAGHRRIGILLGSLSVYTMRERLAGAQAELAGAGVPYDEKLVRDGIEGPEHASRAVADMFELTDQPTAFFCTNNRITLGALQELHRRGSDAALVGFDDFELSHLMPRPLTVIAYDQRELARVATERLFQRIDGDRSWPSTTVLPTHLVQRGLC
ncbi:LacI family DNA-binding transcriptional regulator [Micromonospora sp. WMMA1363]|uniref:LacI family DNA-binding transcriptional regulator n=1 Tax=Micromonospora sp. WMMA1363 TaxID=3053985 RepID=UPI00259C777E|nr:LacI family DNA-binding transcriptional regulator [Micromonospora sp. WMMA1363]MDM4718697.1 LacI family DNA-binding transcriptional regulator [Micromonospora sp. WMMA1363]